MALKKEEKFVRMPEREYRKLRRYRNRLLKVKALLGEVRKILAKID